MSKHPLTSEVNRLIRIRTEFQNEKSYVAHAKDTLETLKKYDVITDFHLLMRDEMIKMISVQVKKDCFETISASIF